MSKERFICDTGTEIIEIYVPNDNIQLNTNVPSAITMKIVWSLQIGLYPFRNKVYSQNIQTWTVKVKSKQNKEWVVSQWSINPPNGICWQKINLVYCCIGLSEDILVSTSVYNLLSIDSVLFYILLSRNTIKQQINNRVSTIALKYVLVWYKT